MSTLQAGITIGWSATSGTKIYGTGYAEQSFSNPHPLFVLKSVKLALYATGITLYDVTVEVQEIDGSKHPNGTVLDTQTFSASVLPSLYVGEMLSYQLTEIIFSGDIEVPSNGYAIVVKYPSGNASNYCKWAKTSIHSGYLNLHTYSGGTWVDGSPYALMGEIWGNTVLSAPDKAISPHPTNIETDVLFNVGMLSWTDPGFGGEDAATSFNVWFAKSSDPLVKIGDGIISPYLSIDPLSVNTEYTWQIDSINDYGTTTGDVWTFTTGGAVPLKATTPSPEDTEEDISLSLAELSWEDGGTGDHAATSYDVWFATSYGEDPFVLVAEGITNTYVSFDDIVLELEPETEYSWWVVSYNESGEIEGYVWTFTTAAGSLPVKATTPSPTNAATDVKFTQTTLSWVDPGTGEQIATSFDVYINEIKTSTVTEPVAAIVSFLLPTSYTWRVDSINADGTTTGDTWTFTVDDSPIINVQNNGVWHPNGTYTAIIYAPDSNVGVTLCYDDAESNLNKVLGTGISVESKLSSLWSRYAIEVPGNVGTGTLYIKWHYDA